MSYPRNPNSVIIKNQYYPNGLKEIDIWNYYKNSKRKILPEVINRDLIFIIKLDDGREIIRRYIKGKETIRLTFINYETLITGRTITIYSTMNQYDDNIIVDIDTNNFEDAKEATLDCYDHLATWNIIESLKIVFTGKTSFHVRGKIRANVEIHKIRDMLNEFLFTSKVIPYKYTIKGKRTQNVPNIDLSPNKMKGAFISLYSLSTLGLKCMEVEKRKVKTFTPYRAMILTKGK